MNEQLEQIRNQQEQSWNRFSPGWRKWDNFNMAFLRPMGDAIVKHLDVQPVDVALDIATGTGEPGLTIAAIATQGHVTGTDLAANMLETAAANASRLGLTNYTTQVADACALPFNDQSFDKVSCRMGFMFFPDMQIAANEIFRVLKPGGRFATSVWGSPEHNFWISAIMSVIGRHIQLPPPVPGAPGMFRCGKPGFIADMLINAGFSNAGEEVINDKVDYGDADAYWQNMMEVAAPIVAIMDKADAEAKAAIKRDVYELVNSHAVGGKVLLEFEARIIYAEKP